MTEEMRLTGPTLSWASAKQASVPFSRAPPSFFEGAVRRPDESG
jgi:hypothetical protein